MTDDPNPPPADEGGDPPCWAHRFGEPDPPVSPRLAEDYAAAILDQLTDAVIVCDPTGIITYWNQAATSLLGWSAEEAAGETLDLIIPERLRPRHWAGWNRAVETGETAYAGRLLEVPALHRNGDTVSITFTVTLLTTSTDTATTSVVAIARDDTERRRQSQAMENELRRLQRSSRPA